MAKPRTNGDFIALTRCFFCNEPGDILIDRYFKDISELNNKVVSMSPCSKCEELMKQGVMLIGINLELSDPGWDIPPTPKEKNKHWMPNPYRSGHIFVLKDEAIRRMMNTSELADYAISHRWIFIDYKVLIQVGLVDADNSIKQKHANVDQQTLNP